MTIARLSLSRRSFARTSRGLLVPQCSAALRPMASARSQNSSSASSSFTLTQICITAVSKRPLLTRCACFRERLLPVVAGSSRAAFNALCRWVHELRSFLMRHVLRHLEHLNKWHPPFAGGCN